MTGVFDVWRTMSPHLRTVVYSSSHIWPKSRVWVGVCPDRQDYRDLALTHTRGELDPPGITLEKYPLRMSSHIWSLLGHFGRSRSPVRVRGWRSRGSGGQPSPRGVA